MRYHVNVGPRAYVVEVAGGRVTVDGEPWEAHLAGVPDTPLVHLLLGGDSWTVATQALEEPGRWALGLAGERYDVHVMDERSREIQVLTGRGGGVPAAGTLRAPMPGLVVRVEVVAGQRVAAGEGVVVVEAMKMENELRAARAAVVAEVHVRPGEAVEKGSPLVTFSEDDQLAEPSS